MNHDGMRDLQLNSSSKCVAPKTISPQVCRFVLSLVILFTSGLAYATDAVPTALPAKTSSKAYAKKRSSKTKAVSSRAKRAVKKLGLPTMSSATVETVPTDIPGLTVEKIQFKGNKKIENDAASARLVTKVGDTYSSEKVRQDVEALFKTGYFYDIRVERLVTGKSAELIYNLVEKPSVVEIAYAGNSEIETNDLKEPTGLKAYEILNMNKIREATEKLQKLYEDKGYFLARISPRIETVTEGESVKLTFDIQENEKVKVKRVTFLGNKNLPEGLLKSVMQTQEGGFFSFVSGSGAYKQDAFDRDVQLISYRYFNEGYVQVKVDRPQVYVTPDRKGIFITIRVEEGERFKVGTVDFSGDLLFDRDDLFNSIDIDESAKGVGWYNHEVLLKDLRTLQAKYGDLGYAYANIIPRTRVRDKDKEVDITFEIDKGNKVYFHRINVVGNNRTRDKVVRRELQIREGELYNETRKRESMDNVKRLGYFEEVNFNSSTPSEGADLMNIDIVVKERNTGSIQLGAGYSTYSQFIFNGQINQTNLFGRGQRLGISVDLSSNQSLFNFNFTEPYFLDTEWSLGFDAYQSRRLIPEQYTETKKGGAVRVGHPLAPYLHGFVRYKLEDTEIDLDPTFGDHDLYPVPQPGNPNPKGNGNGLTSSSTFTLEYDKRDDRFAPTKGLYVSGSIEYAGLGGDKKFTKGIFSSRLYRKIFWDIVSRQNLTYGKIKANNPGDDPPYNELFLLGGANSLRGYNWFAVGKKKFSNHLAKCYNSGAIDGCPAVGPYSPAESFSKANVAFGGSQELMYNGELEFPLISEAGIKGVLFYDVGEAEDDFSMDELRQDVGFGFRWFSPIGPLRFEWGFPIARRAEDPAVSFQFAIGAPF
jgi:outer membrane protein insertion porin family